MPPGSAMIVASQFNCKTNEPLGTFLSRRVLK